MSNYDPRTDSFTESRLIWMRDYQPGRLRELMSDPAKLLEVLTDAVQAARKIWYEAEQKGYQTWEAKEMALAVLCPAEDSPKDSELPLTDREWEQAQHAVRIAPLDEE